MHHHTRQFQPGDQVRFRANGVTGTVLRNTGPALNSRNGCDVVEWRDPEGSTCVHNTDLLDNLTAPETHH